MWAGGATRGPGFYRRYFPACAELHQRPLIQALILWLYILELMAFGCTDIQAILGLKLNVEESNEMRLNSRNNQIFEANRREAEWLTLFSVLGEQSVRTEKSWMIDVRGHIRKANAAFIQLYPVQRSGYLIQM